MRRLLMLVALVLAGGLLALPIFAQETTPEVTPETTMEPTAEMTEIMPTPEGESETSGPMVPNIVRFRVAYFVPDGPPIDIYVDGELSDIQLLSYPAMTGWVEFPANTLNLSFVPQGGDMNAPLVGPITLMGENAFKTIVLVGSAANGTANAISFNENMANLTDGCARTTVLHAIEGGPVVDIVLSDGTMLAANLGFAGVGSLGGITSDVVTECSDVTGSFYALRCVTYSVTTMVTEIMPEATDEAMDATEEAAMPAVGISNTSSIGNCATQFDLPESNYSIQVNATGTSDALVTLNDIGLSPNSFNLIAIIGGADNPGVFAYALSSGDVSGILANQEAADEASMAEMTPEATIEANG
ncbi:MAG: DUF4397 domain-containing protein [Anaerolineae bacterium]|nr:DUF4397 domain-containing protein [Anaerolineae bacterium]